MSYNIKIWLKIAKNAAKKDIYIHTSDKIECYLQMKENNSKKDKFAIELWKYVVYNKFITKGFAMKKNILIID